MKTLYCLLLTFSIVSLLTAQPLPPAISSFTPISGNVGSTITITGTNFNATAANNIIRFGAVRATVTGATPTSITVTVPVGATFQPISVLDNATMLTGYSSQPFITTFTSPVGTGITNTYYKPRVDVITQPFSSTTAIADFDGDGKIDLVTNSYRDDKVFVYANTTIPGSTNPPTFAASLDYSASFNPIALAAGDLNGDGRPEVVVINLNAHTVSILRNTSQPGAISFIGKVDFPAGNYPNAVAIADVDGDGKPELIITHSHISRLSILQNTFTPGGGGSISFAPKVDFETGSDPYSVAIGDLDKDGKPEIVVANAFSATLSVFRNTSTRGSITTASFAEQAQFQTGAMPRSVAIADLDGDGKFEMIAGNYDEAFNSISVFRNTATPGSINNASFAPRVDFATGKSPYPVIIGDVDGDGKLDLLTPHSATGSVAVLRNTATPGSVTINSFAPKIEFSTNGGPNTVAIGDLNGDGSPDLLAPCNTGAISFLQVAAVCTNNIWEGTVSTSWNDPANWSCGSVPVAGTNVFINTNKPRYPVITSNVTCKQLHLDPDVILEIEKGIVEITGKD